MRVMLKGGPLDGQLLELPSDTYTFRVPLLPELPPLLEGVQYTVPYETVEYRAAYMVYEVVNPTARVAQ